MQPHLRAESRRRFALQLLAVAGLTLAAVTSLSVTDAIAGGWGAKLLIAGRMAVLIALCSYFLWSGRERWSDLGLRRPDHWWRVPLLVGVGFVLVVAVSLLVHRAILPGLGLEPPRMPRPLDGSASLAEGFYWGVVVAWGSAAFGEELLARGFILDRIRKLVGSERRHAALVAIAGQAALFGAFHLYQGFAGAILTGLTGLVLGLVWLWGGRNLWPCIILHGLVNSLAASGL